jgi:hypothetical protein
MRAWARDQAAEPTERGREAKEEEEELEEEQEEEARSLAASEAALSSLLPFFAPPPPPLPRDVSSFLPLFRSRCEGGLEGGGGRSPGAPRKWGIG